MMNRLTRQSTGLHPDPRMGRMLLVSFGIHIAIVLLFSGLLLPRFKRDARPVYMVNLVNLPVKAPQAGRPDARPKESKPEPKKPEPVKMAPPEAVAKKPEAVRISPKPAPKAAKAPEKKAPVAKAEPPRESYDDALSAIDRLKRKKEIEDLQKTLAALGQSDTRQAASIAAPAGMLEGKGAEAGPSWELWIRDFLKANWSLSKYQVSRMDLETTASITYDANGNLLTYRIVEPSGDNNFDKSVRAAILKDKMLPKKPEKRLEVVVTFNLKDLLE